MILLDIDGTLTNDQKIITPKTKQALKQAQANGCLLVLASGRPVSGLVRYYEELDMHHHHGLLVAYNGSKVVDCQTQEVYFNQPMSIQASQAVLKHLKAFDVIPMIDKGRYMHVENVFNGFIMLKGKPFNIIEYEARAGQFLLCEEEDLVSFADFEINKILTAATPSYLNEHAEAMSAPFKDTLSCMFTAPHYFEYTAKGIDKAKTIDAVVQKLGYTREDCIAFGDAPNDLSMLRYASLGIAMANADEACKQAADEVTLSNNEDGIAYSLEKHGLI